MERVKRREPLQPLLWVLLNLMDYWVTLQFMDKGVAEGNYILTWLTPDTFLVYKLFLPVAVLYGLYKWNRMRLLKPLNVVMGIVVVWGVFWWLYP